MGCCVSSPHAKRRYRDPADLDEVFVPLRHFGKYRNNSNVVPDDIEGLPSTQVPGQLATDPDTLLYEAEIDQGRAFRCVRPMWLACILPSTWAFVASVGILAFFRSCSIDEVCCWVRKEYSSRSFFRVYPNRIVTNNPYVRCPWGCCGCGSWNADSTVVNPFDRGAFGFRRVPAGILALMCCIWPLYGHVVGRQRCQCNGSLWNRMFSDCCGWWCDEWPCQMFCCMYHYHGIADADETAFAASVALQAYFEGRVLSREDMDNCIDYWRANISEMSDPVGRKRDICCEPCYIPWPTCEVCFEYCTHLDRGAPPEEHEQTQELKDVYKEYDVLRRKQIQAYKEFHGPVRYSTICRVCGCRRVFGRRGLFFCTEGCREPHQGLCEHKADGPAPSFLHPDIDDDNDASKVLMTVLGHPPANVKYTRLERGLETGDNLLITTPSPTTVGDHKEVLIDVDHQSSEERKQKEGQDD